jgi:hypothetical protein
MSQASEAPAPEARESLGFFRHLFGRVENKIPGHDSRSRSASGSALDLGDIQGFILRGYRMPMVRHFLLTVGIAAAARKLLSRFASGGPACRRLPQPKTERGFERDRGPAYSAPQTRLLS